MRSHKLDAVFLSGSSVPQGCAAGKDGMARHSFFQFLRLTNLASHFEQYVPRLGSFTGFPIFPDAVVMLAFFKFGFPTVIETEGLFSPFCVSSRFFMAIAYLSKYARALGLECTPLQACGSFFDAMVLQARP
jgi:hypothetical protein